MTAPSSTGGWRAKLYEMEGGTWIEQGVGAVHCQLSPPEDSPMLIMYSEQVEGQVLLQSKILPDVFYEKQGGSLILWKEASFARSTDYALSFQEPDGCQGLWTVIKGIQTQCLQQREYGNIPNFTRTQRVQEALLHNSNNDSENFFQVLPADVKEPGKLLQIKLKLDNLHQSQRDYVSAQLMDQQCAYLLSLFQKFDELEAETPLPLTELQIMADILRNIMLLNDPPIIEYLLSDAAFYWVTGIFEYDRSLRERGNYRQFFRQANLRSVLRLSTEVSSGSTLLFRLRFVKDIMLHPTIDEPGVMSINSMIAFTSGELCYQVLVDKDYMRRLFAVVLSMCPLPASAASAQPVMVPPLPGSQSDTPTELDAPAEQAVEDLARPIDGLRFFRELIALSKCIALEKRIEYYKTFLSHFRTEFFHLVKFVLAGASYSLRARALVPRSAADALEESVQASLRQHPAFPLFQHPVAVNRTPTGKDKVLILLESTDFFRGAEVAEALSIVSEILAAITCVCPAIVRQEILAGPAPAWGPTDAPSQDNSSPSASSWMQSSLLFLIIDLVLNAHDLSTVELLGDCLKALFDFESRPLVSNVVGTKTEKDKLLPLFYEHYATWLLAPFLGQNNPAQPLPHSYYHSRGMRWLGPCLAFAPLQPSSAVTASRRVIFDLLGLCACTHSYRAKYFLIRANYVSSIVARTFACRTARTLHLCAVKFIRAILRVKDEFYHRHLEKVDALRPMFNAFKAVATKDNLFTSAVHDLVDTIRTENITTLVEYIVERYGHCFEEVRHVEVFDGLRLRYDQMRDREINAPSSEAESADVGGGLSGTSGGSTQVDGTRSKRAIATVRNRDLDAEDDYFFGDDDSFADLSQSYPRSNGEANHYSNKAGSNAASSGTNRSSNSVGSGGSTGNGASNGQHLPSADFLDSLRHKHVPTKPPSPPHYSLCMHGSPLDGGASLGISEGILEPTGQRSQQDSPQGRGSSGGMGGGRVLDLLSQYDDDSPVKAAQGDDDDFPPSTLPPLKPRFEDDDSAPLSLLKKKRPRLF